jgi:hypothetical protein
MNIGSVAQLRIVYIVRMFARNILLGNEIGSPQRRRVIHIERRKQLAHQRERTRVAPSRLGATSRIASHHQRRAAFAEVTGVFRLFSDLPQARETNTVGVQQNSVAVS